MEELGLIPSSANKTKQDLVFGPSLFWLLSLIAKHKRDNNN